MKNGNALKKPKTPQAIPRNELIQPFLKWAGGKRQLLPEIRKYIPKSYKHYFEPFVGAGAVFFDLQRPNVTINDVNFELINCYRMIKDHPEELIRTTQRFGKSKEDFLSIRLWDREPGLDKFTLVQRAARIIYLNKTCFNGLFRVNSQGQFNVPFGDYRNPKIVEESVIRAISSYLNRVNVELLQGDFGVVVEKAKRNDFIYFDPPYDPLSDTSSFTGYSLNSFDQKEQQRLRDTCDKLYDRGCKVLISNSATNFIRKLYADNRYTIVDVEANRNINSVGSGRRKITELLVFSNYEIKK
jgi:DNA adenine methylase